MATVFRTAGPAMGAPGPDGAFEPLDDDRPRVVRPAIPFADRVFRGISISAATFSLVIVGATAFFLAWDARPALGTTGIVSFFTDSVWNASAGRYGVGGLLIGTVLIALVGLLVAVPLGLGLALFVNEYAPARIRTFLVSAIDLLAALPSLVFGMWGLFALQAPLVGVAQWFADHLNVIPLFRTDNTAVLTRSTFVGGVVVGLMILPVLTSVAHDVMAQCPRELCEGALGLGGSRWGMIRTVILPFGRSGIVGAILLAFGRALGETIAVTLLVALVFEVNGQVLTQGGGSIAELVAVKFGEARDIETSALVAAGLALFILTLGVNLVTRRIVARARSVA